MGGPHQEAWETINVVSTELNKDLNSGRQQGSYWSINSWNITHLEKKVSPTGVFTTFLQCFFFISTLVDLQKHNLKCQWVHIKNFFILKILIIAFVSEGKIFSMSTLRKFNVNLFFLF